MKWIKWCFAIVVLVAVGVGGWLVLGNEVKHTSWRTAKITRGSINVVVTGSGTLNPQELVNVGTQVSGQVSNIYVKVNDTVKKGQLLAEIDPSLLQAQLKQSESSMDNVRLNFEQAGRDLERQRMLLAKDYIAKADLEHAEETYLTAKNSYDSARTQVERDKVNLNYAKIFSPIDGTVLSQDIKLGETVTASYQTPRLFVIAGDMTKMKINVSFNQIDIVQIKKDMPVKFSVDAFPGKEFSGEIKDININPDVQQGGGAPNYLVSLRVDNIDRQLLPGMDAYVSITLSKKDNVLIVPAAALRFTPPAQDEQETSGLQRILHFAMNDDDAQPAEEAETGKNIYILRHGVPVAVPVVVGSTDETNVEVSGKGITEGEDVVLGVKWKKGR